MHEIDELTVFPGYDLYTFFVPSRKAWDLLGEILKDHGYDDLRECRDEITYFEVKIHYETEDF